MSFVGIPSVIQITKLSSAATASMIASAANAGGTNITDVFASVANFALVTVLKTGILWWVCPPLPGVTPATTLVPYSIIWPLWKDPS